MRKVNQSVNTDGSGYWTEVAKSVQLTGLALPYINEEQDFGELKVYFSTRSWDVHKDGLIYTDKRFLKELREFLKTQGLSEDVDYSEQGMQGTDYVSLDVGRAFIKSYI